MTVKRLMKSADLVARQEAGEFRKGVALDASGRVRVEMPARDRLVKYPAQQVESVIGPARCGPAVLVKPVDYAGTGDPVQRQRAESRKQAGL